MFVKGEYAVGQDPNLKKRVSNNPASIEGEVEPSAYLAAKFLI